MKRRLYLVLPDLAGAVATANDLVTAHIDDRHLHFLGRRGMSLGNLHEASLLQKTDVRHALLLGAGLGAACGMLLGIYLRLSPLEGISFGFGTFVLCTIGGALFGAWTSSMIGSSTPNTELRAYQDDIEAGKILLMVDVPAARVDEISRPAGTPTTDFIATLRRLEPWRSSG